MMHARLAYLDHNATAPLRAEAREAMLRVWREGPLNASAMHAAGRRARALVEESRARLARLLGCAAREVVFASGGTEADNFAVRGADVEVHLVSPMEHPAVLRAARATGREVRLLAVDGQGRVLLDDLERQLKELNGRRAQVCLMLASHETGVIQPVAEVAMLAREHGALIHCDAVQAAGRIQVDLAALGVDTLAISAHKFGGPQGAGALIVREGVALTPLLAGGGQEWRRRAGTENIAGIVGMVAALDAACAELEPVAAHLRQLGIRLEAGLRELSPEVAILSAEAPRLPGVAMFAHADIDAEVALIAFDLAGVALSRGAACASGKVEPSPGLEAMGVPRKLARNVLRVSMGRDTVEEDITRLLDGWRRQLERTDAGRAA